jgi:hypothetical protein
LLCANKFAALNNAAKAIKDRTRLDFTPSR